MVNGVGTFSIRNRVRIPNRYREQVCPSREKSDDTSQWLDASVGLVSGWAMFIDWIVAGNVQ